MEFQGGKKEGLACEGGGVETFCDRQWRYPCLGEALVTHYTC
jgi:hypothetical protein